ncbi:MAG: hypothetical protein JWQ40_3172 [Segetibacter sp.]|nr:hypothetical protein [Segetibacter sp.]
MVEQVAKRPEQFKNNSSRQTLQPGWLKYELDNYTRTTKDQFILR